MAGASLWTASRNDYRQPSRRECFHGNDSRMLNRLIIAAICILTLLLALGGAMRSPSYEDCETENSYDASGQKKNGALYLTPPGVVDGLGTWAECLSVVANKNGDAITGLATVLLTLVTGGLVWLAADQSNTSRAELRAYVKLSHVSPGLVGLDERFPVTGTVVIAVQAKNSGQTPATVTDVFLKVFSAHKSATLPPRPDYTGERPPHDVTRGFLVAGGDFIHHPPFTFEKEHAE